jgi:hypothetical protein
MLPIDPALVFSGHLDPMLRWLAAAHGRVRSCRAPRRGKCGVGMRRCGLDEVDRRHKGRAGRVAVVFSVSFFSFS